jgi:hypothetical protein
MGMGLSAPTDTIAIDFERGTEGDAIALDMQRADAEGTAVVVAARETERVPPPAALLPGLAVPALFCVSLRPHLRPHLRLRCGGGFIG